MGLFGGERRRKQFAADLSARLAGLLPYFAAGRFAEVEAGLRAWIQEAQTQLGPDHRVTLLLHSRYAQGCIALGWFAQAETEAAAVLELSGRNIADPATVIAWDQYADALNHQGRHEEAAQEYTAFGQALGADPAQRVRVWLVQAYRTTALIYLGRFEEAGLAAERTLRAAQSIHGEAGEHIRLSASNALSRALTAQGRTAEAESVARQALVAAAASRRQVSRLQHVLGLNLAGALSAQGRYQEALDAVSAAVAANEAQPSVADAGAAGGARARALLGLGRRGEAVTVGREALAEAVARFGETHARVQVLRGLLAEAGDGR